MTEPSSEQEVKVQVSTNGVGDGNGIGDGAPGMPAPYCAYCGGAVDHAGAPVTRFGHPFCSEDHGDGFAREVRDARARAAAGGATISISPAGAEAAAIEAGDTEGEEAAVAPPAQPGQASWKGLLKMAVCCGAPLLAIVVLAGGGGALLGAAGAILPLLLFLACPVAMFFMMRGMNKSGHGGGRREDEREK